MSCAAAAADRSSSSNRARRFVGELGMIQPQVAELTTVCASDRAGFAWSEIPSRPRTFNALVDELEAVLRSAAGERHTCSSATHSAAGDGRVPPCATSPSTWIQTWGD